MDFFWWKTWTLTSNASGVDITESMRDEVLPTRAQAFFVKAYVEASGLTIDDLYSLKVGEAGFSKALHLHQIKKFVTEINEDLPDGGKVVLVIKDRFDL